MRLELLQSHIRSVIFSSLLAATHPSSLWPLHSVQLTDPSPGLLRHAKSDSSADSFMPMLIYVVLQANPENLVSNVQYILRFRNQDKLGGEAGYYLSSLVRPQPVLHLVS